MVGFIALLDTVPYYILATTGLSILPAAFHPYLWVAGALAPFPLFIQFLAILISAGSMSEEYEAGTAEVILAKPVARAEFFFGKFLGGYALLMFLILLNSSLSAAVATLAFGLQAGLLTLPGVVLVETYSSALFFSVGFMLGELLRRSSLAYIFSSALIVASQIVGEYLSIAYDLTGKAFYETVHVYLPTTIAGAIPPQYERSLLPASSGRLFSLILGPAGGIPTEASAAVMVGAYLAVSLAVALGYFRWADVSRRVG